MRTMDKRQTKRTRWGWAARAWVVTLLLTALLSMLCASAALAGTYGRSKLSGMNLDIYNKLRDQIEDVAAGNESSTVFTFPASEYGFKTEFTPAELGLDYDQIETGDQLYEVNDKIGAYVKEFSAQIDSAAIMDALMADLPYDLYWYDKVDGYTFSPVGAGGYETGSVYLPASSLSISMEDGSAFQFSFSLSVSKDYAKNYIEDGDNYTVNSTKTNRAVNAAAKAKSIVTDAKAQGLGVYDRLVYYRDAICDLVDYNYPVLENPSTPYGDPWQLINVFDDDTTNEVVCEGYSKAFQYLCDLDGGITCYSVSGDMTGGTGAGAHMWNIVVLNNQSYLVDVTNCDGEEGASENPVGYPDYLFLKAPRANGSVDAGYSFTTWSGGSIGYTYDEDTKNLYGDTILTLSTSGYAAPTALRINSATVEDKDYDGTTGATVTDVTFSDEYYNLISLMEGVDYTVSAQFADKNAGVGKTVTVTVALTDACKAKYTLTSATGPATATIHQRMLTVSEGTVKVTKEYDGTMEPGELTGVLDVSGIIEGDEVTVTATPGNYQDASAETNKPVYLNLSKSGVDANNYSFGENPISANVGEITAGKLSAPTNVTLEGSKGQLTVRWDVVSDSNGYTVQLKKDGSDYGEAAEVTSTDGTEKELTITEAGTYTATVIAKGSGNFADSVPATTTSFVTFCEVTWKTDDTTSTTEYYPIGSTIDQLAAPTREGYTFAGWQTQDGSTWDFSTNTIADNVTFTAQWKGNGTVTMANLDFSDITYGDEHLESKRVFTTSGGVEIVSVKLSETNADDFTLTDDGNGSWTIQPKGSLNAGTYTATVTVTYNEDKTATAIVSLTVNPASPSIAWTSGTQTVPYTGSAVSITPPTVTLVNGETFGGTINYQYQAQGATEWTDGLPSNVGTYDVRASIAAAGNYTEATTATNLTLTISAGVLAQPAVTLTSDAPGKLTATWGEVEHATGYTVQLDGGEAVTATGTSHTFDITSAGSHTVTVTATDSNANFTSNAGSASATFHSVAWMSDGQAYAPTQLCISGSKLTEPTAPVKPYYTFAGWTVDGVAWNFETDAVTQDVTLTAAWTEVGAVTVENVTFETLTYGYAQPEAKNLVITVPDGSQVDSVTISDTSKFNLVGSGSTYNVQPIVGLGAGTHTATITVTYNGGKTATAQVSFEVSKAAQVTPDAPTVVSESTTASSVTVNTIAGQRYIITTSATAPEKTAEGWVTAESSAYTFTGLSASTTYSVYTYIPGDANHEDSDVSAAATVTTAAPAPTDLTADMFTVSASKAYTAQEQAADIATDLSADAYTVRYSAQTGALGESGLPLDAGTYIVTITANEGSGYTGSVPYTMTIGPAAVTITPNEAIWTFGQTVPELTYTTDLTAGTALAEAFNQNRNIALTFGGDGYAGTYAITASALDAGGNFTLTLDESKVVTINPAAQTLTAAGPLSLTVGQSVSLTGHVTSDRSAAISYAVVSGGASISGDTLTASAVGTATVKASASAVDVNGDGAPEYSAAETTFDITVLAKATDETTMTLDVQSVTYGTSIAPNVSGKPGDAGDIAFSYSGTTAGGSSYASSAAPTQAGSYTVTARCESATTVYTAQASFEIKPKLVTIAEVTADDKTYDGLMSTNGGLRLEGAADGEELMLGTDFTAELAFDDPNAGENKTVTLTVTLHNPNYTFKGGAIGEAKTTATITKADDTPVKPILVVEGGSLSVSNVKFGCLYMILPKSATPPTAESNGWVGMSSDCEIIFDGLTSGEEYVIYAYMPETANTKESAVVASDPVLVRAQAQAPQRPVVSATATGASVRFTSAAANQMYMILLQGASAPTAESAGWQAVPASGTVSLEGLTPGEYVVYTYVPAADGVAASAIVVSDAVRVNAPAQMPVASVVGGTTQIIAEPGTQGVLAVEPVEGATYQWYINRGDGKGYVAIDGATQPTYTTTPVNAGNDGFTYYCEVTNAAGTARSAILTLHVRQIPQTGDASRPMLWAALLLAGLGVLLALRPSRRGNAAR